MTVRCVIFPLASLVLLASAARISVRSQLDASSESAIQIGPEGEPWEKSIKYVCMQKWQGSGSNGKFVESFCLANLDKALAIASDHLQFATDMKMCESTRESYKMKVCALKGEAPEGRLSYTTKKHVHKSCFRVSSVVKSYPVIEAAFDEQGCEEAMESEQQDFLPKLTTTTTTIATTTTTTTEEEEEADDELVLESDVDEILEAKALFTEGDELLWDFEEKLFKCCVSSAGKPIKIQDMNAQELPAARSYGKKTGCGYMFGDTYHNGLKSYKGSEPACPVPTSVLREIGGEKFQEMKFRIKKSLGLGEIEY